MTTEKEEKKLNKKQKEKIEKLLKPICDVCKSELKVKAIEIKQKRTDDLDVWFVYSNDKCSDDNLLHSHEKLTINEFEYIKTKIPIQKIKEEIGVW